MKHFHVGVRPKLVFLHIPKTAGTSMKQYLADQYYWPFVCPATDWTSYIENGEPKFLNYQLVVGHFDLSVLPLVSPEARLMTVLRNPLNRTLSTIRHMQRDPNFSSYYDEVRHLSVSEILRTPKYIDMLINSQTGWLSGSVKINDILPSLRASCRERRAIDLGDYKPPPDLREAKDTVHRMDFLGTSESISLLLPQLMSTMGFHPTNFFRRDNVAPGGISDYSDLSAMDVKLLEACNNLDLELYEYCTRLIRERTDRIKPMTMSVALEKLVSRSIYDLMDDSFELNLSAPLPGSGWHDPEKHAGIARWTGPFNEFTLEIPLDSSKDFVCKLTYYCLPQAKNQKLAVEVDGCNVECTEMIDGDAYIISFNIIRTSEVSSFRACQLNFNISEVYCPSDYGEDDMRTLGVLVNSVQFECVN